ncbi:MAG: hypothetical protein HZC41_23335 [Chloroflexi bacterium]|nr:hypothetical protein [Chloroflexota bacterium]
MADVTVRFEVDGDVMAPEQLDEQYELAELLDYTEAQIRAQMERQLGDLRCEVHGQPPRVVVTAQYSSDTEQMELAYHVDTCCKPFLLRAVQALNR